MSQFSLLSQRRFAPLFATQFLGAFNDNVFKNALVIFIAFNVAEKLGRDSSLLVIFAGGVFILPFFLFSATAGQVADKYEKAELIRRIKIAEIVIMLLAAAAFYLSSIEFLLVVLFLMGCQSTAFGPIKYGILPQLLTEAELTGGNGLIQMATYLAILLGTITGGLLVAMPAHGTAYVSITVVLLACLGWLTSRWVPPTQPPDPSLTVRYNIAVETWRVLKFASADAVVLTGIIAISWFWFMGATFLSLVPSYAKNVLHGDAYAVTALLAAFSIGIGLGSLLCERLSRGSIELALVPVGALGISIFATDLCWIGQPATLESAPILRVLFDLAFIGAFGGLFVVPLYALVQSRSESRRRARIIAANNVINALLMVASAVVTMGLYAAGLSIPQIYLFVAITNLLVVGCVVWRVPEFRQRLRVLLAR